MRVVVVRLEFTEKSTRGEMWLNGLFAYYTLEPVVDQGEKGFAIPLGSYDLKILWSGKFHRLMPHVLNVPNRDAIEIHWGNFPQDSTGCTMIGLDKGTTPDFIGQSHLAFNDFFTQLQEAEQQGEQSTITYTGEKIV